MVKIRFYNSRGEVLFDKDGWHLTEALGLLVPSKTLSGARYINQPGQTTTSCVANPRTITLSGDIDTDKNGMDALSYSAVVLDDAGVLEITTDRFTRQIGARCTELVFGERHGPFRTFVVQFLCDCPYFEDIGLTEKVVYGVTPMLNSDTVLPAVFSSRTSIGDVNYTGSAFCEPLIYVSIPQGEGILRFENCTTGKKIEISYMGDEFSELIIDTKNRTITDNFGASRLDLLTDDSFFDGFYLVCGENLLSFTNSNMDVDIDARLCYRVRYSEAVI